MLERIYGELAKLIAKDIYDAARQVPETFLALKETTALQTSGSGLPEAVLQRFDEAFTNAMSSSTSRGFAKWRADGSEVSFDFHLTSAVVTVILRANWADAASRTADGVNQVDICGGSDAYNRLINAVAPRLVERAIKACVGTYHGLTDTWGWEVLAPSRSIPVAHRGKTDFAPHDIFYMEKGTKRHVSEKYMSAKRLLHARWFGLFDPPTPFEGPYLG